MIESYRQRGGFRLVLHACVGDDDGFFGGLSANALSQEQQQADERSHTSACCCGEDRQNQRGNVLCGPGAYSVDVHDDVPGL